MHAHKAASLRDLLTLPGFPRVLRTIRGRIALDVELEHGAGLHDSLVHRVLYHIQILEFFLALHLLDGAQDLEGVDPVVAFLGLEEVRVRLLGEVRIEAKKDVLTGLARLNNICY